MIRFACLIALVALIAPAALAQGNALSDGDRDASVLRALKYLDSKMGTLPDIAGSPRKQFTTATWGLILVLVQDDRKLRSALPEAGARLREVVDYLAKYVAEVERRSRDPKQLPAAPGMMGSNSIVQYNWPLGMAAILFAEMVERGVLKEEARSLLGRVLTILRESQQESGGWGHGKTDPQGERGFGIDDYPSTLVAASDIAAAGLGAGYDALKIKDRETLERAGHYFLTAQLDNGNFPYDPSQRAAGRDVTGVGRTAGALFALAAMGVKIDGPAGQKSLAFLRDNLRDLSEGHGSAALCLFYGALACHLLGGEFWSGFEGQFFRRIVQNQKPDGSYESICEGRIFGSTNDSKGLGAGMGLPGMNDGTDAYVTAIHTTILLLDTSRPKIVPNVGRGASTRGR